MEILTVENLCKTYPEFSLQNVSFSMEEGTVMGFIGRNGAGKTTTLKSILRLVHPDGGQVTLFGRDMARDEQAVRQQLGFVSGGLSYYPRKRLSQITAATRRFYPAWDEVMYRRCLERFRLSEQKRTSELSEGMKVKFQLTLAMSHGAKLLILDEPTSGLDPVSRDDLLDLFLTLVEEDGVSVLFSTHITSDLEKCADTITYIQNGKIFASQPKEAFLASWRLVSGTPEQLSPTLAQRLLGLRQHRASFTGLLRAEDAAVAAGCTVAVPTLEEIMVHLEKEADAK